MSNRKAYCVHQSIGQPVTAGRCNKLADGRMPFRLLKQVLSGLQAES